MKFKLFKSRNQNSKKPVVITKPKTEAQKRAEYEDYMLKYHNQYVLSILSPDMFIHKYY